MTRLTIVEQIDERIAELQGDPGEADRVGNLAMKAFRGRIGSTDWNDHMREYVPNDSDELTRLCGNDDFIHTEWGLQSLLYIVLDSACGTRTTRGGGAMRTIRAFDYYGGTPTGQPGDMEKALDLPAVVEKDLGDVQARFEKARQAVLGRHRDIM